MLEAAMYHEVLYRDELMCDVDEDHVVITEEQARKIANEIVYFMDMFWEGLGEIIDARIEDEKEKA